MEERRLAEHGLIDGPLKRDQLGDIAGESRRPFSLVSFVSNIVVESSLIYLSLSLASLSPRHRRRRYRGTRRPQGLCFRSEEEGRARHQRDSQEHRCEGRQRRTQRTSPYRRTSRKISQSRFSQSRQGCECSRGGIVSTSRRNRGAAAVYSHLFFSTEKICYEEGREEPSPLEVSRLLTRREKL